MLNAVFTPSRIISGWIAAVVLIVAVSVALGARLSTTALMFVLCMTPAGVIALLVDGAPAPSVTHIFSALRTKDGRS